MSPTHDGQDSSIQFPLRRVFISDDVDPRCVQILADAGIEATLKVGLSPDALAAELPGYDGLVVRSATRVTRKLLEAAPSLKVVGRAGTGVDNIDLEAATERGILVLNAPGGNTVSAAEHACTLLVCLTRRVHLADASMRAGRWDRKLFTGTELHGKTLAVVGLGRIGREVANRMRAFGMRTIGYDPIINAEQAAAFGVEWMELEQLWPHADAVTLHVPLLPHTANLIDSRVLARCRRGVFIVNAARGGLVNEADLLAALESGQCGGAGLDVFAEEPPKDAATAALIRHERVVTTPHLGASTVEAQSRVAVEIAEQFVRLAKGLSVHGAVNGDCLPTSPEVAVWQTVALRLAQLLSAVDSDGGQLLVRMRAPPALARLSRPLQAAAAAGVLMTRQGGGPCRLVGALETAKRCGIEVNVAVVAEADVQELELDIPDRPGWSVAGVAGAGGSAELTRCRGQQLTQPLRLEGTLALLPSAAAAAATQLPPIERLLAVARSANGGCVVCRLVDGQELEGYRVVTFA